MVVHVPVLLRLTRENCDENLWFGEVHVWSDDPRLSDLICTAASFRRDVMFAPCDDRYEVGPDSCTLMDGPNDMPIHYVDDAFLVWFVVACQDNGPLAPFGERVVSLEEMARIAGL